MPTMNYTTDVPVARTISEIQTLLVGHGAVSVAVDYADGKPSGLAFSLPTPAGQLVYALPVDVAAVHALLIHQRIRNRSGRNIRVDSRIEQAERVAWRVIKDWLAAQLALIEAKMATLDQVMLPYQLTPAGTTVYQAVLDNRALEAK